MNSLISIEHGLSDGYLLNFLQNLSLTKAKNNVTSLYEKGNIEL